MSLSWPSRVATGVRLMATPATRLDRKLPPLTKFQRRVTLVIGATLRLPSGLPELEGSTDVPNLAAQAADRIHASAALVEALRRDNDPTALHRGLAKVRRHATRGFGEDEELADPYAAIALTELYDQLTEI